MMRMDQLNQINLHKIDEIQEQLAEAGDINQRLQLYAELIDELQKCDVPKAIEICDEAVALARQAKADNKGTDNGELADCMFHMAAVHARSGNYLKTVSVISEFLPLIEQNEDQFLLARTYNLAGVAYGNLGNHSDAIDYLVKALKSFQEIGDQRWEAAVLNNMGHLYWQIHNPAWALTYLSMSLNLAEKQMDKSLQGEICNSLCSVYLDNDDCKTALDFGMRSLALYQETGNKHAEAGVCDSIGDVYQKCDDPQKAMDYYQIALSLSQETGNNHEEIEALLRIGRQFTSTGQCDSGREYLERALEIATRLETKRNIYECHDALMQLHKSCGNFQQALEHSEKLFSYYCQVHNEEQDERIQSLAAKHQFETMQKDAEIYRLKNAALQDEIDVRKKAQENLQQLAIKDHLTGLFNRYYFFELSETSYRQVIADNQSLSIIMIDVDNFKHVNDMYGHASGDVVLQKLADTMQASLRRGDIVARYGGDEFVILLPGTGAPNGGEVAERLRKMVDKQIYEVEQFAIHVTCSIGIAYFDGQQVENMETLLKRADIAMYEAKQSGGNHVTVWKKD